MYFNNKKELLYFLKRTKYIGFGSQGTCYYDSITKNAYKIFNQFLEDEYYNEIIIYNKEDIMRFNNIKNNTFIFPNDVIYVDSIIVGYVTKYVNSKPLHQTDPLNISLTKFIKNIKYAHQDIETLSQKNIILYDLLYNTLYGNHLYVTDTDEFGKSLTGQSYYKQNIKYFNQELYLFFIDGYFNNFVNEFPILKKMYNEKDENIIEFLNLFKKYLSEYLDKDIDYLKNAKKCIDKNKTKTKYIRII